jgi:hypothetical protein
MLPACDETTAPIPDVLDAFVVALKLLSVPF